MSAVTLPALSLENPVSPQLHKLLRDQIIACELAPGQRISETEIAAGYEVSRQPVREAFIKLAEEDLVSIRPQRGTFIKRISISAALTARFIREAVEADLVRKVVENANTGIIKDLELQIKQQRRVAKASSPAEFMQLDEQFHQSLALYAKAPDVSAYLEILNSPMTRVRNISAREFSVDKFVTQHSAIVKAIKNSDPDKAVTSMRNHLQQIIKDLPHVVANHPDYFEHVEALNNL